MIERAVLFCDGQRLGAQDLPSELRGGGTPSLPPAMDTDLSAAPIATEGGLKEHVKVAMSRLERELVGRALQQTNGNVTHAARLLKISRKGLQLKMKELGLREAPREAASRHAEAQRRRARAEPGHPPVPSQHAEAGAHGSGARFLEEIEGSLDVLPELESGALVRLARRFAA